MIDQIAHPGADRDLVFGEKTAAGGRLERGQHRRLAGLAVEGLDPRQPTVHPIGMRAHPDAPGGSRIAGLEHAFHQRVLVADFEAQIAQQPGDVGALLEIAGAHVGEDLRATVMRPEDIVAALEIAHLEAVVHRMRLPAEEHDRRLGPHRAFHFGEHAGLAALDKLEIAEAETVLLDHAEDEAVAVVARLDAVDLVMQRSGEPGDVRKVPEPLLVEIGGDGERVLRVGQIGADDLDRVIVGEGFAIGGLLRHPVAEKHIDVAVAQAVEGDGHRQHGDLGIVAEPGDQPAEQPGGGGHVRPADVGQAQGAARGRIGGEGGNGGEERQQGCRP